MMCCQIISFSISRKFLTEVFKSILSKSGHDIFEKRTQPQEYFQDRVPRAFKSYLVIFLLFILNIQIVCKSFIKSLKVRGSLKNLDGEWKVLGLDVAHHAVHCIFVISLDLFFQF